MKKRAVRLLAIMLSLQLCACGTAAPSSMGEKTETTEDTEDTENTASPDEGSGDGDEEAEETMDTSGGSPWIDSDLKENLSADMPIDPKDDFHLYVNRDWALETDIPEGKSYYYGMFSSAEDAVREKAMGLMTDTSLKGKDAKLIQDFYAAVIDWDARNELGLSPLEDTVERIRNLSSIEEIGDFLSDPDASYRVPYFCDIANTPSFDDASRYIVDVADPEFLLDDPAEYKERTGYGDRSYDAYCDKLVKLLTRLGYSQEEAKRIYEDSIEFETKMAEDAYTSDDIMSPDIYEKAHNVMTPEEVYKISPDFPLLAIAEGRGYKGAKEYNIDNPAYIKRINGLFNEDNLDTIKDYLLVQYVNSAAVLADKEAFDAFNDCNNAIFGSSGQLSDEEMAYNVTKTSLPDATARAYLEKYDKTQLKQDITELCVKIAGVYHSILEGEDWLSAETKDKALEKLDSLRINAVYPDKWKYDYEGIDFGNKGYYEDRKTVQMYELSVDASRTNGTVDKEIWDNINIFDANAFYNPQDNSINIILGMLDGDFLKEGMKKEELLGGVGFHIGHEISHAFDTSGAQYDKDGNLADWWTEEDYDAFQKRADKLIAYYDTIVPWKGQKVFGANIQGEAIADMGSVKALLTVAEKEEDFDYNAFFNMAAQNYKIIETPEDEEYLLTQDPHPLSYLRTNVTLQQFDKFCETYGISEGDNMYLAPEDRITVW